MASSRRFARARLGVLALTVVLLLIVGVLPALARPAGGGAPGLRDWLSRAMRALARRDADRATQLTDEVVVYGPIQAATPTGTSTTTVEQFSLPSSDSGRRYQLKVENGASDGSLRVSTGSVELNGAVVVTSAELAALASGASLMRPIVVLTSAIRLWRWFPECSH